MKRRILDQVVGHKATIARLLKLVEADRLPPSWLFVGAQGQGKKLIALGVAQAFLCERSRFACGECPSCLRVANRQSEGLILVEPQGAGNSGMIKIETARMIIGELSLSILGRGRIVVIDEAEKLNPQAANALLKSVEEPPPRTHFILIASSQDAVLGTLRSRSQIVRFGSLTSAEMGSLGRDEVDIASRESALQLLQEMLTGDHESVIAQIREQVEDRESAMLHLKLWLEFLCDELGARTANFKASRQHLANCGQYLIQAERDIQGNCDLNITFENLAYELGATK